MSLADSMAPLKNGVTMDEIIETEDHELQKVFVAVQETWDEIGPPTVESFEQLLRAAFRMGYGYGFIRARKDTA